jgi:hypothetical protein
MVLRGVFPNQIIFYFSLAEYSYLTDCVSLFLYKNNIVVSVYLSVYKISLQIQECSKVPS